RNYFYPASTVKLPVILLSLEKVNKINDLKEDIVLNRNTRMSNLAGKFCNESSWAGNPNDTNPPSIAKYAEQILLVSDNTAFSKLYEFLGQKYIHEALYQKGYDSIRIVRRLVSTCNSPQQNKCTNPVLFHNEKMQVIYKQEEICNDSLLNPIYPSILLGKAHIDAFGKYQNSPLDCTYNNFLPLYRLHEILIASILPEALAPEKRFYLKETDYLFLKRMMGAYPREGQKTKYLPEQGYFDAYKKYFLYGQNPQTKINPNIRIFNIVGLAYGFAIDSAYIVDFENNVEFFLTAVIHTNRNGVLNDNAYEYASEGMPFLKLLSEVIFKYELAREKKYKNDFKEFKIFD
ncbi:MAG: serine hydrolase, partial [Raineya sp.]